MEVDEHGRRRWRRPGEVGGGRFEEDGTEIEADLWGEDDAVWFLEARRLAPARRAALLAARTPAPAAPLRFLRGRPPLAGESGESAQVVVRLPRELRDRIAVARRDGRRSTSDVVRAALDEVLPALEAGSGHQEVDRWRRPIP